MLGEALEQLLLVWLHIIPEMPRKKNRAFQLNMVLPQTTALLSGRTMVACERSTTYDNLHDPNQSVGAQHVAGPWTLLCSLLFQKLVNLALFA